jgi:hypothetical protein
MLAVAAALTLPALASAADGAKQVTFAKDVAPILQAKCQDCHRVGSMAPMPLTTYEETRPWARAIKERVTTRQMPPWHVDKTIGIREFKNDMSLTDEQIDTIARWVDSGAPLGNPKDLPPARQWPEGNVWEAEKILGPPDLVIKGDKYTMPARSQDVWWRPVSNIPLTEPRWVRAVEMRPQTPAGRRILHHAVAYLAQDDPNSLGPGGPAIPEMRNSMLMEWAIGKGYDFYRPTTGKLLLPGAKISWDMHIHAVGEEIRDGAEIGIWLYPKGQEPKYRTYLVGFMALKSPRDLDIAPNTVSMTEGFTVLKQPARLENFQPHMHLRGKAMQLEAILPDGRTQMINHISNFNFNWMTNYIYTDESAPVFPKGTIIHSTAWHDNTKANKNNPDPEQWVGWGDRTVDEMAHIWVNVTYISEEDYQAWAATHKKAPVAAEQDQQ